MDEKQKRTSNQEDLLRRLAELEHENRELRAHLNQQDARGRTAVASTISELRHSREVLKVSEGWLRALVDSSTDYAIITLDLTGRVTSWNSGAQNIMGWNESEVIGRETDFFFTLEDREAGIPRKEMKTALAEGRAEDLRWHVRKDGSLFWAKGALMPFRDHELLGFLKILRDRTREKIADEHVLDSKKQLREILESISDAFYAVDREWRFTYVNRKAEQWWSKDREDLIGKIYPEVFPQIVGTEAFLAHDRAMQERQPFQLETRSPVLGHWVDISIYPTADGGLSVFFRDITERKRAEEHQRLLIHELNHRVKNTLATVQSIASQTLRNACTMHEAKEAVENRLFALARAHDVLTRENWEAANLHDIVAQAIEPYRIYGKDRILCKGSDIRIAPRMALALAMAFQELATNAVKYGALHNEAGLIDISWHIDHTATPPSLRLRWEEMEGPPVKEPERRGFGTRLIERSLAHDLNGTVKIEFLRPGVVCEIVAPLASEAEAQAV